MGDGDWRKRALCFRLVHELEYFTQREMYKLFFPTRHSNGQATAIAKNICSRCPVRAECADDALATGEKYGVRGELTADDRRRMRANVVTDDEDFDEYLAS